MNPMIWIDLLTLVALAQFVGFGMLVARARNQYDVKAPALTGHPMFERLYRVHMNTLELLVIFVPSLYLAAKYWPPGWVAAFGSLYVVGRIIYLQAYTREPASRTVGFGLSIFPILALMLAALVGLVMAGLK
jgi:glutathione S-transferase